jgi:hypothetical protein
MLYVAIWYVSIRPAVMRVTEELPSRLCPPVAAQQPAVWHRLIAVAIYSPRTSLLMMD